MDNNVQNGIKVVAIIVGVLALGYGAYRIYLTSFADTTTIRTDISERV